MCDVCLQSNLGDWVSALLRQLDQKTLGWPLSRFSNGQPITPRAFLVRDKEVANWGLQFVPVPYFQYLWGRVAMEGDLGILLTAAV